MDCDSFPRDPYGFISNNKISDQFFSPSTVTPSHNGATFHSEQGYQEVHDACYACDSPDCGEEPACPGIQVECYDTNCLEDAKQLCGDEFCAGPLAPNDLNGAQMLLQLSESHIVGGGYAFPGQYDVPMYGGGNQANMSLENVQYINNLCPQMHQSNYDSTCYGHGNVMTDCTTYDLGGQLCQYNIADNLCHQHQNSMYVGHGSTGYENMSAQISCPGLAVCPLQVELPYNNMWDAFQGCEHFPMVDNNIDYHNWQHHQQQYGPQGCSSMSMSQQPVLDVPDSLFRSFSNGSDDTTPRDSSDMTSHHGRHYTSTPLTSGQTSPVLECPSDPEAPYYCKWFTGSEHNTTVTCNEKFMTTKALQEHVEEKHCNVLSKAKDGFFCRWEGCDRLACPKNKAFAQKSKLERHVQKHTGYKSQVCIICNNRYATAQTLAQHMKTHNDPAACKCDLLNMDGTPCTYTTAQASQLTMHKRTIHLNVKPLACKFPGCGATFSESSNLSKHNKTHLPVGDFYCGCCGKRFDREDQVKRHWKKHLMEEGNALEIKRKILRSKGMPESDISKLGLGELLERSPIKKQAVILKKPPIEGTARALNQCKRPHPVAFHRGEGQGMNNNHPNAVLERAMGRVTCS